MNSEQVVYTSGTTTTTPMMATTQTTTPMMTTTQSVLPSTTAHSYTVHQREERHLEKERAKESKRALKQERVADKLSSKADKHFSKASTKAQTHGFLSERSAMRHEEKAVKFAAASNFHRQAASESHSEATRAEVLSSLPPRGTLPVTSQSSSFNTII